MNYQTSSETERRQLEQLDHPALEALQLQKLNDLLAAILPANELYAAKLSGAPTKLTSLDQLSELPFTTKEDLNPPAEAAEPFNRNRTFPVEDYCRAHQTSGTRGRPLPVLDTATDWEWWIRCWQFVLDAAEVSTSDRALLAFSFGPFVGFWSAFDAIVNRGVLALPGGGMTSQARVDLLRRTSASVLLCTPTYALHLAEAAAEQGMDVAKLPIEKIIVAGEPGGSVPAIRERIETTWRARVTDHSGATEVGAWGYGDTTGTGLHVIESEFIAEFLSIETGQPASEGELSHLILTSLGRVGSPVIRYRTGDLVRPRWKTDGGNRFVFLDGGVLGRADDMMIIRGVNVFPSAIEQIVRSFPEVVEYRLTARKRGQMDELLIEVEDRLAQPDRIANELRLRIGLKTEVQQVPALSLPRTEHKGRRFLDLRNETI